MEIINKRLSDEKWQLGDVLQRGNQVPAYALIVINNNQNYVMMDITPLNGGVYSTDVASIIGDEYDSLNELQRNNGNLWHRVNAELVIK
ncbi:hypothetical protein [uncultured Lactobacillus sp.]|uniref:hypothetical protein n=1 Tax=uncultured Lactobacillus sp. TaxID=153152 RepID=UPI0026280497|nr:hypothetical protein [uncultured Lactobacillus sp.]